MGQKDMVKGGVMLERKQEARFAHRAAEPGTLGDELPAPCFPVGFLSLVLVRQSHLWQPLQDAQGWARLRTDTLPPPHTV